MTVNRPALYFAIIYTLIGVGWVVFADKLMLWLVPDFMVYSQIGMWKALVVILATGFVLYLAVVWLVREPNLPPAGEILDVGRGTLILVFAVLACAIIVLGISSIAYTARNLKVKEVERLQAIADLKAGQIVAWLGERRKTTEIIRSDASLLELYNAWRQSGDEAGHARLRGRLETFRNAFDYENVLLLDDKGIVVSAMGEAEPPPEPNLLETSQRAIQTGQVLSTDLYRVQHDESRVYIDFVAALQSAEGTPGLAVALRVDPNRFLFPFIQSWPVPSASAETLLFRRDGNDVLFLNELRHRSDTALKQRVPMTQKKLLAVQALEGRHGAWVEGVDYRPVPVLGVVKPIDGTVWFLIAKLDKKEFFAQARKDALWIAWVAILSLATAAAAIRIIHQRRELRVSMIQSHQQAEKLQALQLLDAIAEGSTDVIYAKDAAGRYMLVNRELSRFVAKTRAEVLGKDDTAVFQPVDAERLMDSDRDVMNADQVATSEETLRTIGGIRTFLTTRGPLHDEQGRVIGIFGIARDITDRKQQERELRASEARFRAIFDGVNDAIFLHDAGTGAILDVNAQMTQMYGYSRREARHLSIADLSANTPPYTEQDALRWFARAQQGEAPVWEWLARRHDGSLFWVEMSVRRAEIAGRACILALSRDIRERKEAEAVLHKSIKLQEQIGLLSQALEQSPISIMITDTAGNIEYVNRRFTLVTGYSKEDLLGQNPRILRSADTPRKVHQDLWETITSGREWSGELHNRRKNGELFWEYERILPIRDAAGHITNFLAVIEDVTERKQGM